MIPEFIPLPLHFARRRGLLRKYVKTHTLLQYFHTDFPIFAQSRYVRAGFDHVYCRPFIHSYFLHRKTACFCITDCAENKRSFTDNRSYDRRSELPAAVMIKITILNNEIDSFDKLFMLEIHTGSHNCCFHIFDLLSGFSISNWKIPSSIPVV